MAINKANLFGKIFGGLIVLAIVGGILFLIIAFATAKRVPVALPPNSPAGQRIFSAQLKSNSKWQIILTTFTEGSPKTFDQKYYILFNPQTSTDPTQTVFDSRSDASSFVYNAYTTSPVNKDISPISTNLALTDYQNFQEQI